MALERVDEVLGDHLARASCAKSKGRALVAQFAGLQVVVEVVALRILGEGRMRRT
jgi:hypothetical protein